MNINLGKIKEVSLREIWDNEEKDFTPWLMKQQNLDLLSETIGLSLVNAENEIRPNYSKRECDIKCRIDNDDEDKIVIIENQIEESDSDHLARLIVYASGLRASVIIWLVKNARLEHISAINWLNENTTEKLNFYLIEIHAIKINDSIPAPLFKIISQPDEHSKIVKSNNEELTRSHIARYDFWTKMNAYIENNNVAINKFKVNYDHYHDFSVNSSNYVISVALIDKDNKIRIGLWIRDNMDIFEKFKENKDIFESELGSNIEWDEKEGSKASSISIYVNNFSYDDTTNWDILFKEITDNIIKFRKIVKKLNYN